MGIHKLTIKDVPLEGTTVLVRADYNVPLKNGKISDDLRIRASVPTLDYLLEKKCAVIVMSHLGRPEGKDDTLSLEPIAKHLGELLQKPVTFVSDCIGDKVVQACKTAQPGTVTLLENLRFYAEEEANDAEFAQKIATATKARYFVQDGFGVVHRAHASTAAITQCIPSVAGLLLEKEYTTIVGAMETPKRPLVAVMGGAKVSDKIGVIERFVEVADTIIIGGAMANTFLANAGVPMGKSKVESGQGETLQSLYDAARAKVGDGAVNDFIVLPTDLAVATEMSETAPRRVVASTGLTENDIALDIGDAAIEKAIEAIKGAGTVIWNGTLGYAEFPNFAHGSARMALALASQPSTQSIIGGGDTADFVLKWDGHDGASFSHVSTGGGASLELMSGLKLPGIESLLDARK